MIAPKYSEPTPKYPECLRERVVLSGVGSGGAVPCEHAFGVETFQDGRGGFGAPSNKLCESPRRHTASRVGGLDRGELVLAEAA